MYIPRQNLWKDQEAILAFVRHHSFATLVSIHDQQPIATHIPIELVGSGEPYTLEGHIARANIQSTSLVGQRLLVIFQGAHAYISSSWYDHLNVPTWNYQAVHIYGRASLLTGEELQASIARLVDRYEAGRPHAVSVSAMPPAYVQTELRGVVGFRIAVDEVQAQSKLIQNRDETNTARIIEQLRATGDPHSQAIATLMEEQRTEQSGQQQQTDNRKS